ncbi:MAG: transposase, partial [Cuniculiplasma sp.]
MRIRKYWFFPKTIKYVNLDDFGLEPGITGLFDPNIPDISISPSNEMDLILYRNPSCPGCGSMDIVRNGTFIRTLETGIQIRVQRYLCNSCCYKFEARPPNYGYGKHFPHNMEEKS